MNSKTKIFFPTTIWLLKSSDLEIAGCLPASVSQMAVCELQLPENLCSQLLPKSGKL